jgi:hypothetical protein
MANPSVSTRRSDVYPIPTRWPFASLGQRSFDSRLVPDFEEEGRVSESEKETAREMRAYQARELIDYVVKDYAVGDIDLVHGLVIIDAVALNVGTERREKLLGEFSAKALDCGKPRYLGHRKPRYPSWLKRYSVDLVQRAEAILPIPLTPSHRTSVESQPLDSSILRLVTWQLAFFGIWPGPVATRNGWEFVPWDAMTKEGTRTLLPMRVLYRWYLDRKRREGTSRPRGRPSKRHG